MSTDPIVQYVQTIDDATEIFMDKTIDEPIVDKAWISLLIVEIDEPHPTLNPPVLTAPSTKFFNNVIPCDELREREEFSPDFIGIAMGGGCGLLISLAQTFHITPDVLELMVKHAIASVAGGYSE